MATELETLIEGQKQLEINVNKLIGEQEKKINTQPKIRKCYQNLSYDDKEAYKRKNLKRYYSFKSEEELLKKLDNNIRISNIIIECLSEK